MPSRWIEDGGWEDGAPNVCAVRANITECRHSVGDLGQGPLDVGERGVVTGDVARDQLHEQALEPDADAGDRAVLVDGEGNSLFTVK